MILKFFDIFLKMKDLTSSEAFLVIPLKLYYIRNVNTCIEFFNGSINLLCTMFCYSQEIFLEWKLCNVLPYKVFILSESFANENIWYGCVIWEESYMYCSLVSTFGVFNTPIPSALCTMWKLWKHCFNITL